MKRVRAHNAGSGRRSRPAEPRDSVSCAGPGRVAPVGGAGAKRPAYKKNNHKKKDTLSPDKIFFAGRFAPAPPTKGSASGLRWERAAPRPRVMGCLAVVLLFSLSSTAHATGFTDYGQDITPRLDTTITLDGAFRVRLEELYNLDLDHGLTPSGQPLFPTPLTDPASQWLSHADMRLRTDLAIYAPGAGIAVKARFDLFDNLPLGGSAVGVTPAVTSTQLALSDAIRVKRLYGEAVIPFGLVAAGRMGSHWGLGMLTNGGDCADCDSGDSADRIALITPLVGHIWAVSYDFTANGPTIGRPAGFRQLDLGAGDNVRTLSFAFLRFETDMTRERRRLADRATVEYGAVGSYRWQAQDVPASYLPLTEDVALGPAQVMHRGYSATALDGWFRLTLPQFRLEAEAVVLWATIEQASLVPGVELNAPLKSLQYGFALQSQYGAPEALFAAGLDAGLASGDKAPGFGAFPKLGRAQPGDLEGAQSSPPTDNRVDNFRFHPDFRIDRILFREIIGTITDAFYIRPHMRFHIAKLGPGQLTASLAGVASWAVYPESTPGGQQALGIELDPTLVYESVDGFQVALEHAVLFPLAGLDNGLQNISAQPAQLLRLRLMYLF
jgi:uncharacterized protein (TIGR04551 family)